MSNSMNFKQLVKRAMPASMLDVLRECKYRSKRVQNYRVYQEACRGKHGLEIGGPSIFFRHVLPIYPVVAGLDGVNFSQETLWEGVLQPGDHFEYTRGRVGRQFIAEAADLQGIASGRYQFLISSNCLEHVANPLKALEEWLRVIQPGGHVLLVLPRKEANFDHRRPVTRFEHLLDDYENNTSEEDMTHLEEILKLHDLARDAEAGSRDNFIKRSMENFRYRGLHHHVFDLPLIERMLSHFGVTVLLRDTTETDFVVLGQSTRGG